jgi:HSP20 family protein
MLNTFFNDLYRLNREMNRYFYGGRNERSTYWPETNIYENDEEFVIVSSVPGLSRDQIQITVKDNSVKISGDKKTDIPEGAHFHLRERKQGHFERNFLLNGKIDAEKINAEMKNGLLLVKVPKAAEAKPRTISIN